MNNGRRMLVAALGTMTSAFVVAGQAEARSVESGVIAPAQSGAIIALDQEELKRALSGREAAHRRRSHSLGQVEGAAHVESNWRRKADGIRRSDVHATACDDGMHCTGPSTLA